MQQLVSQGGTLTQSAPTLAQALDAFEDWAWPVPPTRLTGILLVDRRLGEAFRTLAALPDCAQRLKWIEDRVFTGDSFPAPDRPVDPYRTELIRWWLDLWGQSAPS